MSLLDFTYEFEKAKIGETQVHRRALSDASVWDWQHCNNYTSCLIMWWSIICCVNRQLDITSAFLDLYISVAAVVLSAIACTPIVVIAAVVVSDCIRRTSGRPFLLR